MPRRRRNIKRSAGKRIKRWLSFTLAGFILVTWIPVLLLRWLEPPATAFMLHQTQGADRGTIRYRWTDWPELGSAAALAVMAAEDQKFPQHYGFDVVAIQDAVLDRLDGKSLRGASTITQQVAKNLFLWPGQSFLRKGIEAYFTAIIELSWSKKRILEMYLNIAEFGPGIYGIPAASRIYFEKTPRQLTDADAALLAAVLPNPKRFQVNRPSEHVRERQRWILQHMGKLRRYGWLNLLHG
jgi:monofunctional biosynthetic peptidoglycan transglycosylase